ncbi:MarR family transcriptional regulator [Rhodoferax sp.]|uniref:MarR family winged helix-turn-helix transcriptional regulator n=1 Tax=Rhodoferax sp. TaxID=50421 RepID=UPI00261B807C|nr:MarR family transcriptional regulator [Rhodoferax sp.]MDD3935411.1 MarR family transcriptional regulator [Rhodoferax sp.]
MRRAFEKKFSGSFLTMAQARVLVYVSRHEGIRQIELAELLDVQPITLSRLIDPLVGGGVLERRSDPKDRRAYQLYLLPQAKTHLESIEQVTKSIREEALGGFTEREVTDLLNMLQRMHDKLSAQ